MFTLTLASLILLSTTYVSVHVEKVEVPHLSEQLCKAEMRAWRAKGPAFQAACIKENEK